MRIVGRVHQMTTSTGAGALVLDGGAPAGRLNFADRYSDGEEMPVTVQGQTGGQFQTGLVRYNGGPDRVTFLEIYDSSSGGLAVSFAAGVKDVFVDAPARVFNDNAEYVHQQSVPAAVWTIIHNLHRRPSVRVVDSAGTVVVGRVQYTDETTLTVTFSAGFSGTAYVN